MEVKLNTAKIMSKGQITLPVDIRRSMGLSVGDRVTLIYADNRVIMMNPAVYAMEMFQKALEDEWENAGINSDEDVQLMAAEARKKYMAKYRASNKEK